MEKKTVFLELKSEMINRLDQQNILGDRSMIMSNLLDKQLQRNVEDLGVSTDLTNMMDETGEFLGSSGELNLINSKGSSLGNFDVNIPDKFENIVEKIGEISTDHIVRVRSRNWR